ncbi:CBS domain-containing protein [Streptomyces sp. NPDC096040]|uniref:CBS domain-containing protein n=1 Tax=Streptomyces sp. NPDC096040 TaxID=3155541 RepID=UPI003330A9DC
MLLPDLLAVFGVRRRDYQTVPVIAAALKDAGLATVPSFTLCGLKAALLVVAEETVETPAAADGTDEEDLLPGTLPQHSFKIGDIPSARDGLASVPSSASLTQATHIMRTKGYSQLPVIDGMSDLCGVVTWSSVAARYETGMTPTLANALVKDSLPVAEVHQELFTHLPAVTEHGYLLVRSNSGRFTGIVTAADITARFEDTALPFFLVGEIEFRLRKCLGSRLDPDVIRQVQNGRRPETQSGDIADLMFGQYVTLLKEDPDSPALRARADANWQALGWVGVDRTQFVHDLDRVRMIRNKIAHFDNEPLGPRLLSDLREFLGLLKQIG